MNKKIEKLEKIIADSKQDLLRVTNQQGNPTIPTDNGLIHAANQAVNQPQTTSVYVGGLSSATTEAMLAMHLRSEGVIGNIDVTPLSVRDNWKSFKLEIPSNAKNKVLQQIQWPEGVNVRLFRDQRGRIQRWQGPPIRQNGNRRYYQVSSNAREQRIEPANPPYASVRYESGQQTNIPGWGNQGYGQQSNTSGWGNQGFGQQSIISGWGNQGYGTSNNKQLCNRQLHTKLPTIQPNTMELNNVMKILICPAIKAKNRKIIYSYI